MAKFIPTAAEQDALESAFEWAEGYSGTSTRFRQLLCAWWNASELGGFDLTDLWSFDHVNLPKALTIINMIARMPPGTYANDIPGFDKRARALAERRDQELDQQAREEDDS